MQHPLEFVSVQYRKRFFFIFLAITLLIFGIFCYLDQPLRTDAAPNGIVSFELAGTPQAARAITDSWKGMSLLLSSVADQPDPNVVNVPYAFAAFGLGFDYLFMPMYALALAFGTLLVAQKHAGWMHLLAVVAGYGAFVAALFDAVENFALWQALLGAFESGYPAVAAFCATIKFGLLIFGLVVGLLGWIKKVTVV